MSWWNLVRIITIVSFSAAQFCRPAGADEKTSSVGEWHTGRKIVWSNQRYLNVINHLAIGNDGFGYVAADNSTLFVTEDRGEHWREVRVPISGILNKVYANDAGAVVVVRDAGNYAWSLDHGKNWSERRLEKYESLKEVGFIPDRTDVIWLLLIADRSEQRKPGKLLLRTTTTGGRQWQDYPAPHVFDRIQPIDTLRGWARRGGELFTTADGGKTWTKEAQTSLSPGETVIKTQQVGTAIIMITDTGRVLEYTKEFGWKELPKIPATSKLVSAYFVGTTKVFALAAYNQVYGTDDPHNGWSPTTNLVGRSKQVAFWKGPRALIRSSDGPIKVFEPGWPDELVKLEIPSGEPRIVALSQQARSILTTSSNQVLSSEDNGLTWTVTLSVPSSSVGPLALAEDGWGVLVTGERTIWTTSTGGADWQQLREIPGVVTRIAVGSGHRALIEARGEESWSGNYQLYRLIETSWEQVPSRPDFTLFKFVTPDLLVGLDEDGKVQKSTDIGRSWTDLSSDIQQWAKNSSRAIPQCNDMFWLLDGLMGWIACSNGVLFHTKSAGARWELIDDSQMKAASDFGTVFFLDHEYGIVYDTDRDDIYETSDGGQRWQRLDTDDWGGGLTSLAFTHDGRGIVANSRGTNFIREIRTGITAKAKLEPTGLRSLRVTVEGKDGPIKKADLKDLILSVRVRGLTRWVDISKVDIRESAEALLIDWEPTQQEVRIDPGQWLAIKVHLKDQSDIVTTATLPEIHYLPLINRHAGILVPAASLIGTSVALFLLTVTIYAFRPKSVLLLLGLSDSVVEGMKEVKLGFLVPVVRMFVFDNWLLHLASLDRVISPWLSAYQKGATKFENLGEKVLKKFAQNEMVLDCWMQKQLSGYRAYYEAQLRGLDAGHYVPVPVLRSTTDDIQEALMTEPSALSIRTLLDADPMAFGIVGRGGTGKTTFLGQIGSWAMETDAERRLLSKNTAIAVLLRKVTSDVLNEITIELKKGFQDDDDKLFDPTLIKAALHARRLILMVDSLSELDEKSIDLISNVFGVLPVSLLVFSSRRAFANIAQTYREVSPQELQGGDLNRFVSQYIFSSRLRNKWSPRDELTLSERLIEMLERRSFRSSLPALFVKLLLDSYDPHFDTGLHSLPVSLAETVQRFVRSLKPMPGSGLGDNDLLVQAATELAKLSLGRGLVPHVLDGELVRTSLADRFGGAAPTLLKCLIEGGILLDDVTASGSAINFRLDPVAEYLAAISYIKEFTSNELAWSQHLAVAESSSTAARNAAGYLEALLECFLWMRNMTPISENVERKVRRLVCDDFTA